jgi:putative nucleotidyltransferase with HDIG domain
MGSQEDFVKEAAVIKREGVEQLLGYLLNKTDFFTAPASTMYHGAYEKGLVHHSLGVFDVAKEMNELFDLGIDLESIAICTLFHDVCKANYYVKEKRNKKIDGVWHEIEVWGVKDQLPLGHGEKSLYIISKYMQLTNEEALAIRWHLGNSEPGTMFNYPSGWAQRQAFKENKLVALVHVADMATSYLIEEWEG